MSETTPPPPPRVNPVLPLPVDMAAICSGADNLNSAMQRLRSFRYNPMLNDVGRAVGDIHDLLTVAFAAGLNDPAARAVLVQGSLSSSYGDDQSLIRAAAIGDGGFPAEFLESLRDQQQFRANGTTRSSRCAGRNGPYRLECSRGCGCAAEAPDRCALAHLVRTWEYRPHGHYTCPACSDAEGQAHAVQEQGAAALHVCHPPGDGQGVRGPDGLQEAAGAGEAEGQGPEHIA